MRKLYAVFSLMALDMDRWECVVCDNDIMFPSELVDNLVQHKGFLSIGEHKYLMRCSVDEYQCAIFSQLG